MSSPTPLICNFESYENTITNLNNTVFGMIVSICMLVVTCILMTVLYLNEHCKNNKEDSLLEANVEYSDNTEIRYNYV